MTKEEFLKSGLIEQHVLGLTSPEEEMVVQQFLQQYPEMRDEVESLHNAMHQYASQYAIPSPDDVLDKANPVSQPVAEAPRAARSPLLLYTLLFLLAGASMWLYNSNHRQGQNIIQLEAEYASLKEYCDQHDAENRRAQALLDKTKLPTTEKLVVSGTSIAPQCFAVAYWNPELKEGWLDPTKLPPLADDRQYQIWADVHGEMISIGLIPKDQNSLITINYLPEAESINITQEVLGGVDHPTVDLLTANGIL